MSGSHFGGSSWIAQRVYWTSPWKAGIASSILLVGSSGVNKLEPNQVNVSIENMYAKMVSPVVLVCLGVMSMDNTLD